MSTRTSNGTSTDLLADLLASELVPVPDVPYRPAPDITLTLSHATLQYALKLYAAQHFIDRTFTFANEDGWDISIVGKQVSLAFNDGTPIVHALLHGTCTYTLSVWDYRLYTWSTDAPIRIRLAGTFMVNNGGHLCLAIDDAQFLLPDSSKVFEAAKTLVARLVAQCPPIPLVSIPMGFDIPGVAVGLQDEIRLHLCDVQPEAHAVSLAFQLWFGPQS